MKVTSRVAKPLQRDFPDTKCILCQPWSCLTTEAYETRWSSPFRWRVAQLFYETVPRSHAKVVRIERMVQPVSWRQVGNSNQPTRWKGWMPGVMTYCSPCVIGNLFGDFRTQFNRELKNHVELTEVTLLTLLWRRKLDTNVGVVYPKMPKEYSASSWDWNIKSPGIPRPQFLGSLRTTPKVRERPQKCNFGSANKGLPNMFSSMPFFWFSAVFMINF